MENSAYDFTSIIFSGSDVSESEIDEFISSDFGTFDGRTRAEFISDITSGDNFEFTSDTVTLDKVDIVMAADRAAARAATDEEAFLNMYFSDGSVITEHIWMAKENGKWVITGNDRKYESELTASAYYIMTADAQSFYSGLNSDFYDEKGIVSSISVTGPGLGTAYSFLPYDCTDCDGFYIDTPTQTNQDYGLYDDFINLYDTTINDASAVTTNGVYTISTTYTDGTSDNLNVKVYGQPVSLTGLTANYFPMVPETTSTALADYLGQTVAFQLIKPTAYSPRLIEYRVEIRDYEGNWYDMEGMIPLNNSTFTLSFPSDLGFTPLEAEFSMTAYDADGKEFTSVFVLETGDSSNVDDSLDSETVAVISSSLEPFNSTEQSDVVTVFAASDDVNVQNVLTAVSDAADAGLTSAEVREAAEEAGVRKPASGPALEAYNQLVAAFQTGANSVDATVFNSIKSLVNSMTDTKLAAFGQIVKTVAQAGFSNMAAGFKSVSDGSVIIDVTPAIDTDADLLAQDLATLYLSDILGANASAASVTDDLVLQTTFTNGTVITWESDYPEVIADDGTVTRPKYNFGDVGVNIYATAVLGTASETFSYSFFVIENELTDPSFLAETEAFFVDLYSARTRGSYEQYVDPDMDYFAGFTRDQFVSNGFIQSTSVSVEDFEIYTQLPNNDLVVHYNMLNSSGEKYPKYYWLTKRDDGLWYIAGNGWLFARKTILVIDKDVDPEGNVSYEAGLQFDVFDRSSQGIEMVVVDGPGTPEGGLKIIKNTDGKFVVYNEADGLYGKSSKYFLTDDEIYEHNFDVAAFNYAVYEYAAYTGYDTLTMEPIGEPLQVINHNVFQSFPDEADITASPEDYFVQITDSTEFSHDILASTGEFSATLAFPAADVLYGGGELYCETLAGSSFNVETYLPLDGSDMVFDLSGISTTDLSELNFCSIKTVYFDSAFRKYRTSYDNDISIDFTYIKFPFDVVREYNSSIYIGNTEILNAELLIETGASATTEDVTAHLFTDIYELDSAVYVDGQTYGFTLRVYDKSEALACEGSATIEYSSSLDQEIAIDCAFSEADTINNTIFNFIYTMMESDFVTADDIDKYIAVDFGIERGETREEFIEELLIDAVSDDFFNFESYVELLSVNATEVSVSADGVSEMLLDFYFSDGTIDHERIYMTEELGSWVIVGDGRLYEAELTPAAVYQIDVNGATEFKSGIMADFYDPKGLVTDITVSAYNGFTSDFYFEPIADCTDCDSIEIVTPNQSFLLNGLQYHFMAFDNYTSSDTAITDPMFTIDTSYVDSSSETFDYTIYGTLLPADMLTAGYFITLNSTASTNLYDYESGPVTLHFSRPSYTVDMIEVEVDVYDSFGNYNQTDMAVTNDKDYFVLDISNLMTYFTPEGGTIRITAFDSEGKAFMTVYELDYDDTAIPETDPSALAMVYAADEISYGHDAAIYEEGFIICGITYNSTSDGAVYPSIVNGDANGNVTGYMISTDISDIMYTCDGVNIITDSTNPQYGYTYLVGSTDNYNVAVILVDDTGSVVWSKVFTDSNGFGSYFVDSDIINDENLLILLDGENPYIIEIDPAGSLIGQYEMALDGTYSGSSYYLSTKKMFVDPDSNKVLVTGAFFDGSVLNPMFIYIEPSFSAFNIVATEYTDSVGDPAYESVFEGVAFTATGNLLFSGYVGDYYGGDILLAEFDGDSFTFNYEIFDNYTTDGSEANAVSLVNSMTPGSYFLKANISTVRTTNDYTQFMKLSSDTSGFTVDWQTSIYEDVSYFDTQGIATDDADNIAFFGSAYDLTNDIIGVLYGGMNADGTITDATLVDQLPGLAVRDSGTGIYPLPDVAVTGGTMSTNSYSVSLADASATFVEKSITEVDLLPLNP
ncbi:MAG: hypothetical protein C0602_11285 [Denitrovibrio sp.]|nr:MAG: hypothetical protein C0602_11285 [Denitrovibrio sp.]